MALPTVSKLLELKDVKITPLDSDPSGGAPSYGTPVDVPGIMKLSMAPDMLKKELSGDNQVLDVWSKVRAVKWTIQHAKLSLGALSVILGGSVTLAGVSPNQTQTYSLSASDDPKYFKIEGQVVYVDEGLGDAHFVLYKCKAETAPKWDVTDMSGDFAKVQGDGLAIPLLSNGKMFDIVFNETAVAV